MYHASPDYRRALQQVADYSRRKNVDQQQRLHRDLGFGQELSDYASAVQHYRNLGFSEREVHGLATTTINNYQPVKESLKESILILVMEDYTDNNIVALLSMLIEEEEDASEEEVLDNHEERKQKAQQELSGASPEKQKTIRQRMDRLKGLIDKKKKSIQLGKRARITRKRIGRFNKNLKKDANSPSNAKSSDRTRRQLGNVASNVGSALNQRASNQAVGIHRSQNQQGLSRGVNAGLF